VGATTASTGAFTTLAYTGTLTGGTGVINIGSGQLYKDASGNVGIGPEVGTTSSANQRLLVTAANEGAITYGLYIHNDSFSAGSARISLSPRYSFAYNTAPYVQSVSESTSAAALTFGTTASNVANERMRITSAGNVGIGTSSPSAQLDLASGSTSTLRLSNSNTMLSLGQITGEISFYQADTTPGGTGVSGRIGMRSANRPDSGTFFGTSADMAFFVSGAGDGIASANAPYEALTLRSNGNVGIGTSSPNGRIHVTDSTLTNTALFERTVETTNIPFIASRSLATTSGDMVNEFGSTHVFSIRDGAGIINNIADVGGYRDGADNTGGLIFRTTVSGTFSERMRIDSAGNVGIGTSSPDANLTVNGAASFAAGTAAAPSIARAGDLNTGIFFPAADTIAFAEGGVEAMRIDSSGRVLVGKTSSLNAGAGHIFTTESSDGAVHRLTRADNSDTQSHMRFLTNGGSTIGNITTTTNSTAYVTSSDYRLKEDWQPMSGAITRLNQLKPVNFAWKADGSRVDGFLAHEAQEVVPEAVTGAKDAVDKDGKPQYQGIDQSKLVPLLTAALQEAVAKIAALEARLDAANL
jgi:hypothetical protein